jgi:hypothetical protein
MQSMKRWERDRLLLENEYALRPTDARTAFYLAQTCVTAHAPAATIIFLRLL